MKGYRHAIIFTVASVAVFFVSGPHPARAAFGISPPFLNADHLVPGATYTQTVYLVQDNPGVDLNIKANLTIAESVRSWINIDKGFEFVIPKGTRQFPVQITVHIPESAGLSAYSGNLTFITAPDKTGQVTIALGVQVAINLTVGAGIYEKFSVPIIHFPDIEEGWNPLVYVKFQNDGNIPESFDGATYELFDQYGGARLAYTQKNSDFPETSPFSVGEYTIEFPIDFHLGLGQYWAAVNFYKKDKIVASQKTVFQVLKAGSLSGPVARLARSLRVNWPYYAGGIISVVILFAAFRKGFKRRKQ